MLKSKVLVIEDPFACASCVFLQSRANDDALRINFWTCYCRHKHPVDIIGILQYT